ncbi:hypothetical protein KEM56_007225, partial [Ascosphaera pollenicola]
SASVALAATTSTSPSGSASVAPAATSTPTALSGSASVAPASSDPGFDLKEATTKPTPEGSESQPHSQYNYSLEPRRVFSQTKLKITPGEKYNDLRLICEAHEFFVHRLMICTASPVIASALDGPLKVRTQEAESGVYTVKEFSARAVLFMIHWIYYGDYTAVLQEWMNVYDEQNPSLKSSKSVDQETMHAHLELNRLADYYDIYGLTSESRKNIKSFLASHWSACSMTPILLESDDLIADSQVYSFFVSATAAHLKDVVQEVAQKTDAHLPQGFMKDVLNKYFHASKPLFMSDKPGSS